MGQSLPDRIAGKMSERFSLKWTDFQSVVSQSFSVLRQEADFYDVTLVSDDHTQISAHKLVLSASSDFFKSILRKNPHSHPLLYLSGVDSTSLGFVLDYIYQGEVQIYQHELDNFLEVAQKLKIEGLLSSEEPETKHDTHFDDQKVESFPSEPDYSEMKVVKTNYVRSGHGEKVVSLTDMTEVDEKIQQLMERRDGRHYCKACDYSSQNIGHIREHVERHIDGLSYPCQFCDKSFRTKAALRWHRNQSHKVKISKTV